jgi:uncharacterized protein (DUF342 family)
LGAHFERIIAGGIAAMASTDSVVVAEVMVSVDRMTVTLKYTPACDEGIVPADLIAQLEGMGVKVSDRQLIEGLARADGRIRPAEDIVLLEGTPAATETPARLELLVKPPDPSLTLSHYERLAYLTAEPGQVIAKIHPAVPGVDGVDVMGDAIPHKRVKSPTFNFVKNVELDKDGQTIRATSLGRIHEQQNKLWVDTALEIPGDVDFACGNIDVSGAVDIRGSVFDLFKVKGFDIHVGGTVEAAEVTAAHELVVNGGIVGKDKGLCTAGENISCKFITNATLRAGGNVNIGSSVVHARIICTGRLSVERGPLTSGHVTANGGVCCRTLGSPTTDKVLVEVGFDEAVRATARKTLNQIAVRRNRAANIRASLTQILKQMKNVSGSQKEQATLMLREAVAAEREADELFHKLKEAYEASKARQNAEIIVKGELHAGVTIRFPKVEATIDCEWKGPLRIAANKREERWEIVLIDMASKSEQTLPSRPSEDRVLTALERAMAG